MAGKDVFRRNGYELSWASASAKIDGDEFFGFTGIDYEEKLERAIARGMGRDQAPRGMTSGQYSVDGAVIKGHKASIISFLEKLGAKNSGSYGKTEFFFMLQYVENDVSITEELYGCRVNGRKPSLAQGSESLIEEVPIQVLYAKLKTPDFPNGLTLFDNAKGRY
jgi:hypothetical protein